MVRKSCEDGTFGTPVAPVAPERVEPSPGCDEPSVGARTALKLPRTARAPAAGIPFFARRTGAPPRSGASPIAGIELPRGSRCKRALGERRARERCRGACVAACRGLPEDRAVARAVVRRGGAEHYFGEAGEPAGAGRASALAILRRKWERLAVHPANRAAVAPFGTAFGGLAQGTARTQGEAAVKDPFEAIARRPGDDPRYAHAWLVLVPANRPSDVLETLQLGMTGTFSDGEIATVLRSWEQRFGAVLVDVGPGSLTLVASRPATGEEQALRLAAEHWALAPPGGRRAGRDRPRHGADAARSSRRSECGVRGPRSARVGPGLGRLMSAPCQDKAAEAARRRRCGERQRASLQKVRLIVRARP